MFYKPSFFFFLTWVVLLASDLIVNYLFNFFYTINIDVYLYVLSCLIFSLMGGLISTEIIPISIFDQLVNKSYFPIQKLERGVVWSIILCLILFLTAIERYLMIGSNWFTIEGINSYRFLVTEEEIGERLFSFLAYFNFFFFFSFSFLFFYKNKLPKRHISIIVIATIIFIYLSSSRSMLFIPILTVLFMYIILYGFRLWMILIIILLSVLFVLQGMIVGKDDPFSLIIYLFSPIHAFNEIFMNNINLNQKMFSFRFLHPLFCKIGILDYSLKGLPYIEVPMKTNVYTVFYVYWNDLKWISFVFWFFFGFISDLLYKICMKNKDFFSVAMIAILYSCIVLSVFYDYFTSSAFFYISFLILFFLWPKKIKKYSLY